MARAVKKIKTKSWYDVHAPKVFNEENLVGTTICADPEKVLNRTMDVKLSQLLGDVRKSDQKIKIKITEVKGFDAYTSIFKYELARMSLMRMIRRRSSKIESVDDETSKDGKIVRAKSVLVTKGKATETQRRLVINQLSSMIRSKIKEHTFDSFVLAVISKQIQKEIIKPLRKLFPVIALEVRSVEIRTAKKTIGEHRKLAGIPVEQKELKEEKVEPVEQPKEEKKKTKPKKEKAKPKEVESDSEDLETVEESEDVEETSEED